jgi:hypothetical protein
MKQNDERRKKTKSKKKGYKQLWIKQNNERRKGGRE